MKNNRADDQSFYLILGYSKVSSSGTVSPGKKVCAYLSASTMGELKAYMDEECLIVKRNKETPYPAAEVFSDKSKIILPEQLSSKKDSIVCFLERDNAIAVKKIICKDKISHTPSIYDTESPVQITRTINHFPRPKELESDLLAGLKTNHNDFLQSLPKDQEQLNLLLPEESEINNAISALAERQLENGSWSNSLIETSKNILKLINTETSCKSAAIKAACSWLLSQPESPYNPGMFFLKPELVELQTSLAARRMAGERGTKVRFRNRPRSELTLVEEYDPLFTDLVCGPRIMWPNALAMKSLLAAGYETHERIKTIENTLLLNEWCECGWQFGTAGWKNSGQIKGDSLVEYENQCRSEFSMGGFASREMLTNDYSIEKGINRTGIKFNSGNKPVYIMAMPAHLQGCEIATVYGCSGTANRDLRKFAEAHLWRFVARMNNALYSGIPSKKHLSLTEKEYEKNTYILLNLYSDYIHHQAARIGIMLAIPWIKERKNTDGTWGNQETKRSSTLSVIKSVNKLDDYYNSTIT